MIPEEKIAKGYLLLQERSRIENNITDYSRVTYPGLSDAKFWWRDVNTEVPSSIVGEVVEFIKKKLDARLIAIEKELEEL